MTGSPRRVTSRRRTDVTVWDDRSGDPAGAPHRRRLVRAATSRSATPVVDEANLSGGSRRPPPHFGVTAVRDEYPAARVHDAAPSCSVPPHAWAAESHRRVAGRASGCSACAATRSSSPRRSSPCRSGRSRCSCGTSGPPTDASTSDKTGRRRSRSTTPRRADGSSTTSPACCCGSASGADPGRARRPTTGTAGPLDICGVDDQKPSGGIGVHGARGDTAERLLADLVDIRANTNVDTDPRAGVGPGSRTCWPSAA